MVSASAHSGVWDSYWKKPIHNSFGLHPGLKSGLYVTSLKALAVLQVSDLIVLCFVNQELRQIYIVTQAQLGPQPVPGYFHCTCGYV